jgi:hypothetical protein
MNKAVMDSEEEIESVLADPGHVEAAMGTVTDRVQHNIAR